MYYFSRNRHFLIKRTIKKDTVFNFNNKIINKTIKTIQREIGRVVTWNVKKLKYDMPVSFDQNCLHLTFKRYLNGLYRAQTFGFEILI